MHKTKQFIYLFLLSICTPFVLQAKELSVQVKGKSAILYNPDSGAILFQKNAHEPHYPASILKIATALYIFSEKKSCLDQLFQPSEEALRVIDAEEKQSDFLSYPPYLMEHDGVRLGLEIGKTYSGWTLIHGLLLSSGNDAANVLAEGVSGKIPKFMEELNQFLKKLGIQQTRFQNPHGLHHPAQITTAYDMAQITGYALQNLDLCKVFTTKVYQADTGQTFINTSRFLKNGQYQYPKYIAGKTGYISLAGYNLVAAAESGSRKLVAVILGCQNSEDRFEDAIHLFETAFQEKEEKRVLFSKDHEEFYCRDTKGKILCSAKLSDDVYLRYYPSENLEFKAKVVWNKVENDIEDQDLVGNLVIESQMGKILVSAPLYACGNWKYSNPKSWRIWILVSIAILPGIYFFHQRRKFLKG